MKFLKDAVILLNTDNIDSSDLIILSTEILFRISKKAPDIDITNIFDEKLLLKLYLDHEYHFALFHIKNIFLELSKKHNQFTELAVLITQKIDQGQFSQNDSPIRNESRRFFETRLADTGWDLLDKTHFASLKRLAEWMVKYNSAEKYTKLLNTDLEPRKQAEAIVAIIRDFVPETLKDSTDSERMKIFRTYVNSLSVLKDRGNPKDKNTKNVTTVHPGIIKNTLPTPQDLYLKEARSPSVVDLFDIKDMPNGFSNINKFVPFVNSVSGTAYDLALLLLKYIEENKATELANLQQDISNIILAFLLFTCKEGYHSLYEMLAVLMQDQLVDFLFKLNKISTGNHLQEPYILAAFRDTVQYIMVMRLNKRVLPELTPNLSLEQPALTSPENKSSQVIPSQPTIFQNNEPDVDFTKTIPQTNNDHKFKLHVQLRLEISTNAVTKDPQPYLSAIVTKVVSKNDENQFVDISESNGTTELFEFLENYMPTLYVSKNDQNIPLNKFLKPTQNPVKGKEGVVKIPLVNSFNFVDENNNVLKCHDNKFIGRLSKLCALHGLTFILDDISLDNFTLPTRATVFQHGAEMHSTFGKITTIKLKKMASEADSKLNLLILPDYLKNIVSEIKTALGRYEGVATPSGQVEPYLPIAEANINHEFTYQNLYFMQRVLFPKDLQRVMSEKKSSTPQVKSYLLDLPNDKRETIARQYNLWCKKHHPGKRLINIDQISDQKAKVCFQNNRDNQELNHSVKKNDAQHDVNHLKKLPTLVRK